MIQRSLVLIILIFGVTNAWAGIMEIGASANFRRSIIDDDNFQESLSYTGSISYYFWEMSALEISYTKGSSLLSVKPKDDTNIITKSSFQFIGMDLIITLASRQSMIQPYIKLGGAHISKKIVREAKGLAATEIESPSELCPALG